MAAIRNLLPLVLVLLTLSFQADAYVDINTPEFKKIFEEALAKNPFEPVRELKLTDGFLRSEGFSVDTTTLHSDSSRQFECKSLEGGTNVYDDNDTTPSERYNPDNPKCVGRYYIYEKIYRRENRKIIVVNLGMIEVITDVDYWPDAKKAEIRRIDQEITRICDDPYDCSMNRETILRPRYQ